MSRRKLIPTVAEKLCKRCNQIKKAAEFGLSASRKDTYLQDWCKECVREQSQKRYAASGWRKTQDWNSARRLKHYDLTTEYLKVHPCVDCGEADPIVLEFDHTNPEKKTVEISKMFGRCAWVRIEKEIRKCDVVCANCHRKRTSKQFGWRRWVQSQENTKLQNEIEVVK